MTPMRKKLIAGNWKMYKNLQESEELLKAMPAIAKRASAQVGVAVCPPFTSLALAGAILKGSGVKLGAQNMSEMDEGAYTGEISWKMLASVGCDCVILGHSERRQYYGETDAKVNVKAKKALEHQLLPIICVGETLKEREDGSTMKVIATQIEGVLSGMSYEQVRSSVIAYEPVWAIGTGKVATPAQAQEVHAHIRSLVARMFAPEVAGALIIQYGGSVKPDNAKELMHQADIDGALVGGACLKADSFEAIVQAAG